MRGSSAKRPWCPNSYDFLNIPDNLETAVAARTERQRVIRTGNPRFVVVMEEQPYSSGLDAAGGRSHGRLTKFCFT
jgi:hypothetical protein